MSKRKIRMGIVELVFPENSGYIHTATSRQISKGMDFDIAENLILEDLNNTKDLLEFETTIDVDDDTPLYCRHMVHISKDGVPLTADWGRITPFNSNMKGMKINNFMIKTPKLDCKTVEGKLEVKGSEFGMFSGAGDHHASNWGLKSSYGQDRYIRKNDKDNLTSINIDNVLESGYAYVMEATYTNNFNNESFKGKEIILNYSQDLNLFDIVFPEQFIKDRKFYYRVQVYTPEYVNFDIEIRDINGKVIKSRYDETVLVGYFFLDNMTVYNTYEIFMRVKFEDGKVSSYKKMWSGLLLTNRVVDYKPFIEYLEMLDKGNEMLTDGMAVVTTRETYDGKFILPNFTNNTLCLYKGYGNRLQQYKEVNIKQLEEFKFNFYMDNLNILQLPNHDIVIDVNVYSEAQHRDSLFVKYEYNPIKNELTPLAKLSRPLEQNNTAICNSIGVLNDNTIVYIPAYYSETKDANRSNLPLFIVDKDNFTLSEAIPLPFDAKYFVSLVVDKDDNIFIFGGSKDNKYEDKDNNVEYWGRENDDVYQFDIKNKSFTKVATIPTEYSKDIYCLQGTLRLDGKIVLFNGSYSGPGMKIQEELVFDPSNYSFAINKTDMDWDIPFRSNIIYRNGNVTRISAKIQDPQKTYTYISNTKNADTITKIEGTDEDVKDLVVDSGKVINVEDLYPYDTITIKGTGVLRWFRPQGIVELTSSDLIVTRDKVISEDDLSRGRYSNILVLEGVDFIVEKS